VNPSYAYDPKFHQPSSVAASGRCSYHDDAGASEPCAGEAVVSFQDGHGRWQAGCSVALERLVERGEIAPLGQGA
jgi:hypothetical protein